MNDLTPTMADLIPKSINMTFPTAMKEIKNGKKIRRIEWPAEDYGVLANGWLSIFTKGSLHTWKVNDGDIEASGWIIVQEDN